MSIIFNPVVVSVAILCIFCLLKVNVLLALMIAAISAGVLAGMPIENIMNTFISGMGGNSETALSYILLGMFAAAMSHTGLADVLARKISMLIRSRAILLIFVIAIIAMFSQNLIPVHIAFIPILIPPLLTLMNKLQIDRRAVACALAYGLKTPYIVIPAGFGLIFQGLIADSLNQNGMSVLKSDIWHYTWFLGVAMTVGFLIAVFVSYRKPRIYKENQSVEISEASKNITDKLNKTHYITLLAAGATLIIQLWSKSLPLGALVGLGIIFATNAVKPKNMDKLMDEGIGLMGYIAFVMLVAAGFAAVLKTSGGIDTLIGSITPLMEYSRFIAVSLMLLLGLLITIGIGTSFGTIPILAVLFVPMCIKLGLSVPTTVIIMSAAAALGDAGSPASDTTLGPTAGLNADGQHNHIWDTCVPTFLHYNIPLIVFALLAAYLF